MAFTLLNLRNIYKLHNSKNLNHIFNTIRSSYTKGDYKNLYNYKSENLFDIIKNDYFLFRVHLSILQPGIVEKSNLPRQLCLLEGKLFINDNNSSLNLVEGCYLARTKNYIENKTNDPCVVISHVDSRNNLQDIPLL